MSAQGEPLRVLPILWHLLLPIFGQHRHDGHHPDRVRTGEDNEGVLLVKILQAAIVVQQEVGHGFDHWRHGQLPLCDPCSLCACWLVSLVLPVVACVLLLACPQQRSQRFQAVHQLLVLSVPRDGVHGVGAAAVQSAGALGTLR